MTRILACVVLVAACGSKAPAPSAPAEPVPAAAPAPIAAGSGSATAAPDAMAAETAAYEKAKPVFEKYCAACHVKGGKKASAKKLEHFDMTSYPFGGEHSASIGNEIRKVLGIDGGKPTMPDDKPGSVKGDELAAIATWTEAWQVAGKAGVHPAEPADND